MLMQCNLIWKDFRFGLGPGVWQAIRATLCFSYQFLGGCFKFPLHQANQKGKLCLQGLSVPGCCNSATWPSSSDLLYLLRFNKYPPTHLSVAAADFKFHTDLLVLCHTYPCPLWPTLWKEGKLLCAGENEYFSVHILSS